MSKPKVLVFASGGASGFEKLVLASRDGTLNAEIVGVVSNLENGGARVRSEKLGIPFIYFPKPWSGEEYQRIALESDASYFALSGWLKLVTGLHLATRFNSQTVFNIHPGPLPDYGGPGLYGHHVHEAVMRAYRRSELTHSMVSMHFVTDEYDLGPVFFRCHIPIDPADTPDSLGSKVNAQEHIYQARITNMVVNGLISWDGVRPGSLKIPDGYSIDCFA